MKVGVLPLSDGIVVIKIFDISGEFIRPIFHDSVEKGLAFQADWDGRNDAVAVSSGVYFVSVQGAGIKSVRKVILLK